MLRQQLAQKDEHLKEWANKLSEQITETKIFLDNILDELNLKLCDHEWVDCTNAVIKQGWFCVKCRSIRGDPPDS